MTQNPDDAGGASLRILRGMPTDEELAALVAVLAALGPGAAQHVQPRPLHRRGRYRHQHRSAGSWRRHH